MLRSPLYRILELLTLMVVLPSALFYYMPNGLLLPILWAVAIYCGVVHRALTPASERVDWNARAVTREALTPILIRFAISAALLTLLTWMLKPELLFGFVRTNPGFWLVVMVFYPLLSAGPQEIIFRQFFFERYATFFNGRAFMVTASGVAFAFAHIFFHNWVAPLLCLIGGVMFAGTYARHKSLLLVTIEHALYGCFIFTLGLGRYFYHGAIH